MKIPNSLADSVGNERLRWGLVFIAAILWLYALLELRDRIGADRILYRSQAQKILRVQQLAGQDVWLKRAEEARIERTYLESRAWKAATEASAEAAFQDAIASFLRKAGVERASVHSGAEDESKAAAVGGSVAYWIVKAKAEFDFSPGTLNSLLAGLAGSDRLIVVDTLNIRKEPIPRVEMVIKTYFLQQNRAEGDGVTKLVPSQVSVSRTMP